MKSHYWALCAAALAVIGPAANAHAQDRMAEAQARFNEGVKAYSQHDFERARLLFLQSVALVPRGSVFRNLGLAELELGKPVDALHHLRAALELNDLDSKRRSITEGDVRDAYAITGHITIDTNDGATLAIDGEPVDGHAPFPLPIDVMPGKHVVDASLSAKMASLVVDAKPGVLVPVKLPIEPASNVPPVPAAMVPPQPAPVVVIVPENRITEAPAPLHVPFWNTRRELGVGLAAVGIVSAVFGVYFYEQAVDAQNRANVARTGLSASACSGPSQPPACAAANEAWSTQSTDATLNYVLLGSGAAALAAGALLFLWPESSSSAVAATPVWTRQGGGLQVRGEF